MVITLDTPIGEIAFHIQGAIDVFEEWHINYSFGGSHPLREACLESGATPEDILGLLKRLGPGEWPEGWWAQKTIPEIIKHLRDRQHVQIRMRLNGLCKKSSELVQSKVGTHAGYDQIDLLLHDMRQKMEVHMSEEETIVFPYLIKKWEERKESSTSDSAANSHLLATMSWKHEAMWDQWILVRTLTNNYKAPSGSSQTYMEFCQGLKDLEEYVQQHGHLEDNILFRKARQMGSLS